MTKKQSVLTKIKISFERENMQAEYSVYTGHIQDWLILSWLQAHNRNWWERTQWQKYWLPKKKDKILGCKLLKTDPGKKNLDILEIAVKYLDTSNNQLKNPNN